MKNYNKMVGLALLALGTVSVTNVKALPGLCPSAGNKVLQDAVLNHYKIGNTVAQNENLVGTKVQDSKGNTLKGWEWHKVGMQENFRMHSGDEKIYTVVELVRFGSKFIGKDSYEMGLCSYAVVLKPDKNVAKSMNVTIDPDLFYTKFIIDIKQVKE